MRSSKESETRRVLGGSARGWVEQLDYPVLVDPLLWVGVFLPFLLISLRWMGADWTPAQDQAVLELRLGDLAGGDVPMLGAFSRYGWSHPGPLWFYALGPFRSIGGSPAWTVVGSILLAGSGWATMAVFVRRRFGSAACSVAVGGMVIATFAAGAFTFIVPWNPHLAFAWFPLFLVACLSVAVSGNRDLGVAVLVGSALVQLHVGYVVLVGIPLVAATAMSWLAGDLRQSPRLLWRQTTRLGKVLWVMTVLVWVPPVIEQLVHGRDGNVFRLVEFFVSPPSGFGEPSGVRFATAALGAGFKVPPVGLGGSPESIEPFSGWVVAGSPWWALLPLALICGALGLAVHSRLDKLIRASALAGVSWLTGWLALSRIVGDRWPYLFVWRYVLAGFVVAVSGYVIVLATIGGTAARLRPRHSAMILALAVLVAGSTTWTQLSTWEVGQILPRETEIKQLLDQIDESQPANEAIELVRFGDILEGVGDGVLLGLTDRGWDVGVDESLEFKYMASHVQSDPTRLLLVTESSRDTSVAIAMGGPGLLARTTPLDERDEERITELHVELSRALVRAGRPDLLPAVGSSLFALALDEAGVSLDVDLVDELTELNEKVEHGGTCRCAVVLVAPDSARTPTDWLIATAVED